MKNLTINLNNHHAVLSFKKISNKQFETLKWKLIEKNIDEILEILAIEINESMEKIPDQKGKNND